MAERLRKRHQDDIRKKIQADKLIRLLDEHAHGQREMSATQVQSAKILLDKSVSNAPTEIDQTTEHSGGINVIIKEWAHD